MEPMLKIDAEQRQSQGSVGIEQWEWTELPASQAASGSVTWAALPSPWRGFCPGLPIRAAVQKGVR